VRETVPQPVVGPSGARLSEREHEVLRLMADGVATRQIADRLGISAVTVRRHLSASIEKLGVADRAAAVDVLRGSVERRPRS
jgi:DNA-binding NarL/FixJ family response regulator